MQLPMLVTLVYGTFHRVAAKDAHIMLDRTIGISKCTMLRSFLFVFTAGWAI
jgi:hypothetical protein